MCTSSLSTEIIQSLYHKKIEAFHNRKTNLFPFKKLYFSLQIYNNPNRKQIFYPVISRLKVYLQQIKESFEKIQIKPQPLSKKIELFKTNLTETFKTQKQKRSNYLYGNYSLLL